MMEASPGVAHLPSIDDLPLTDMEKMFFNSKASLIDLSAAKKAPCPKQIIKGPWSFEEDQRLRWAVTHSGGPILWDQIAKAIPGRNAKQCRERWTYRISPELKKTPFEQWEDEVIAEERKKIGNRWTIIAGKLPGRTSCAVKNRWYTVLRNHNGASSGSDHQSEDDSEPVGKESKEQSQI